jgi:protein SCO1/2
MLSLKTLKLFKNVHLYGGFRYKGIRLYRISSFTFSNKPDNLDELKNKPDKFINDDVEKQQQMYDSDSEDPHSFYNRKKKLFYYMTTAFFIISGIYIALQFFKPQDVKSQTRLGKVTYVGKPQIGGPFRLIDTKGNIVTHKDFAGKYYLIYFGFTQCPDVCPMSLTKIAKVLDRVKQSKEYKYFDLDCIFVSVDPDRDTPERIEKYCKLFNKSIIGLTAASNDDPELKQTLKNFKIHSSKIYLTKEDEEEDKKNLEKNVPQLVQEMSRVKPRNDTKYSLDHTIVTYLMGPNNNFITYLSGNLNQEEMFDIVMEGVMNDLTAQVKKIPAIKST